MSTVADGFDWLPGDAPDPEVGTAYAWGSGVTVGTDTPGFASLEVEGTGVVARLGPDATRSLVTRIRAALAHPDRPARRDAVRALDMGRLALLPTGPADLLVFVADVEGWRAVTLLVGEDVTTFLAAADGACTGAG